MYRTIALLTAASLAPLAAEAAPRGGGGLSLGTMVVPNQYPLSFPKQVRNNDATGISKVRGDATVGLEGVYYMSDNHRIGASGGLGFGSNYFDRNFKLKYAYIIDLDSAEVVIGGGIGVGKASFTGTDEERFDASYYPLRVEAGPMLNQGFLAEQILLYAQYNIPSNSIYTDAAGVEEDAGPGVFMTIGAEIVVMFGNF
ncbi:MAG: hypothetical protein ACI8RZ_002945 [Myxococcota bacterium]|jgi:hypothetical protein